MVRHLLSVFPDAHKATLSRGYGRKTTGFREVLSTSTAREVGDEPLLFPRSGVRSFVCENRVVGWEKIREQMPEVELLVLDDVFQHRAMRPHRMILLTTFDEPFTADFMLPSGRLREGRSGAQRADVVVVTKCPRKMSTGQQDQLARQINKYTKAPVFFAHEHYGQPYDLWTGQPILTLPKQALGVAGLAKPLYFQRFLAKQIQDLSFKSFPDHYSYHLDDIEGCFQLNYPVIITEKDAVKWKQFTQFSNKYVIVWPIQLKLTNQNEFDSLLLQWYAEYVPHS